ncbi:cupin domain-containing protein [Lacimicrobium alkaliphilum]|uniref:Cupin n=1 Tax=Lacimicrobium alkaliphilum TaxID=1526571 RepID=A0ABQ1R4W8_9ALTE|nr:cupin domain-containing protein [Lacimicrobium alkaliphilum]GGD58380.1 cupin [Lacimicrobium alkaliphilum]
MKSVQQRLVRYSDLIPCKNAFIDTRSPGSDKKENFTIIGPGVSENPDQHIHITVAHGFNIGGARQPPGCLNSQHSHLTEEFFVVERGQWAFTSGVNADDGRVVLNEGDVISIPMDIFRGFENVGNDLGYLYAVLGGDDPGRVLWVPSVFEMARVYGLILLENGALVDTRAGQKVPEGVRPMPVTSEEQVKAHRIVTDDDLEKVVLRYNAFDWHADSALVRNSDAQEAPLVGPASEAEQLGESNLNWEHGFAVRALKLPAGAAIAAHTRAEEEVLMVHQGELSVSTGGETIILRKSDNFTTPIGAVRQFENTGDQPCVVYITRRGNQPQAPIFC